MLSLAADSIKSYQTCARLYDFRHNDKLYEPINPRVLMADRFEDTLKKVAAFFFYKKQGGNIPSYSALLNRWERLWFPKGTTAYDLATEQHETLYKNLASYTTEASAALMSFHENFSKDDGEPFLIDDKFIVPLTSSVKLEGTFDLVLRYRKDKVFYVFKWFARGKKPSMSTFEVDFAILKHSFDFKTTALEGYDKIYGLYDLSSSKPGFIASTVRQEDINALKFWAQEIINDETFPSRRDLTFYCRSCPFYDKECREWNGWTDENRILVK